MLYMPLSHEENEEVRHEAYGPRHGRKRRRKENDRDGGVHIASEELSPSRTNGHDPEGSNYSRTVRNSCLVCWNRHYFPRSLVTTMTKLNESTRRECPTCILILAGISEFFKSLQLGILNTFTPSSIERVKISSSSNEESLSVHLEFSDRQPGFDLDFFTLRSRLYSSFHLIFTNQTSP
jgi:hypothetical protein